MLDNQLHSGDEALENQEAKILEGKPKALKKASLAESARKGRKLHSSEPFRKVGSLKCSMSGVHELLQCFSICVPFGGQRTLSRGVAYQIFTLRFLTVAKSQFRSSIKNNFIIGSHHNMRNLLKDCSIRKAENHFSSLISVVIKYPDQKSLKDESFI